jgi:hypothetical protein
MQMLLSMDFFILIYMCSSYTITIFCGNIYHVTYASAVFFDLIL